MRTSFADQTSAPRQSQGRSRPLALAPLLALVMVFVAQWSFAPVALAHAATPQRPAHALPVRTDPKADAILSAPPRQVKIWFDEAINPAGSFIIVVDPANHEVDERNSRVDMVTKLEMSVGLQLLRPGAYVVVWQAQAADDGHVTSGNFLFRIARADGSVPPVPATLPSGHVPGAAGFGSNAQAVDGPTLLQALGDWLALLFSLFWVGGLIWEVWALPANRAPTPTVAVGARLAARRFQRLAPYALAGALLANLALALALVAQVAGEWRGAFDGHYWQATLFESSFGVYWWMRQGTLVVALLIAILTLRAARANEAPSAQDGVSELATSADDEPTPSWTQVALATLRQTPRLPLRILRGWLDSSPLRQAELALGALLLFAFAMSGHAASTPPSQRLFAVSVDLAHLIFSAVWLGGLLYISVVLVPAARALPARTQAALLARGAPEFGAIAIVSAAALALTGSLNATVHFTSWAQFATTAYGRVLSVKIELFLGMAAISAYHAFWLRPRLTHALARSSVSAASQATALLEVAGVRAAATGEVAGEGVDDAAVVDGASAETYERAARNGHATSGASGDETQTLQARMEDWLRREAMLGAGVLLCVALLALFAGSLTPTQAAPQTTSGAFQQSHTVSGDNIALRVTPLTFGENTFTVTVADAQGNPVSGATAELMTTDQDMDMGEQTLSLKPLGAAQPGVYQGQGDLTMAGHWNLTVNVTPMGTHTPISTTFAIVVGS